MPSSDLSAARAHPRSRGEHLAWRAISTAAAGSSPLTRGAPLGQTRWPAAGRLTPAHAGSTPRKTPRQPTSGAHPRSRGEHASPAVKQDCDKGSSPLTRGALIMLVRKQPYNRLIPAHAGSTAGLLLGMLLVAAHPRSRGEHLPVLALLAGLTGSSPLTRGARASNASRISSRGLIPAHAGSTDTMVTLPYVEWAHPRSRGEHDMELADSLEEWGSSPLTRGALNRRTPPHHHVGLIPAHAGSTIGAVVVEASRAAHPRSRGEHGSGSVWRYCEPGSSPLTRGARSPSAFTPCRRRLIPAHAGSTGPCVHCWAGRSAHPRSRGEHSLRKASSMKKLGSSPLTRGAPPRKRPTRRRIRLIPAHAGSTWLLFPSL